MIYRIIFIFICFIGILFCQEDPKPENPNPGETIARMRSRDASFEIFKNYQATYIIEEGKAKIHLSWDMNYIGQKIGVFRGPKNVAILKGDATSFDAEETDFGAFQYTIVWLWNNIIYDYSSGILSLGILNYEPPEGWENIVNSEVIDRAGYFIYITDDPENFTKPILPIVDTKEIDEENPQDINQIPLKKLKELAEFLSDKEQYTSVSSYLALKEHAEILISVLTEPIHFVYKDVTWKIPEVPGITEKPIIEW